MDDLVSIIMPNYNGSRFIAIAINSVMSQTYSNWELIIVDDNSSDQSIDVIQPFIDSDSRIMLYQLHKNKGVSYVRNYAISKSKGRFISFLDSDDIWLPQKTEKQLSFMLLNNMSFTYLAYEKVDENGFVVCHVGIPRKVSYHDLLKTCYIGCLTVMLDTNYFEKIQIPLNTKREDYALWLDLLKKVDYAHGFDEILARYRIHTSQNSKNKLHMAEETWRLFRNLEKLSLFKSIYYFSNYSIRGVFRSYIPVFRRKMK
jgi:teichuronic acid biosynthesis glycosyltransferase TuaG